jgi:hypothetical protein
VGNAGGSGCLSDLEIRRVVVLGDAVNALDCDHVAVDQLHHPELPDAQASELRAVARSAAILIPLKG